MRRAVLGTIALLLTIIVAALPGQSVRADAQASAPASPALSQVPVVTMKLPAEGTHYRAGTTVSYKAVAIDAEDGELTSTAFVWQVDFHHGVDVDPFVPPTIGRTGSFTIPNTGNTETDVFYRITLTVTDSNGDSTVVVRDLLPQLTTLTINSNPSGLAINVDGVDLTAPVSFGSVVGMKHTIGAESPLMFNNTLWSFKKWSDRGAVVHEISAPAANTTYTVLYKLRDLKNPSFEIDGNNDGAADFWTFVNRYTTMVLNEGLDCTTATDGMCSLLMYGNLSPSQERQGIAIQGNAGDSYTVDFSTKAQDVGASQARVMVQFDYSDGTSETANYYYPAGTFDWTAQSINLTATKHYKKLWIYVIVEGNSTGLIWADDFRLTLN